MEASLGSWLRQLDDDALSGRLVRRFAHPDCSSWQAWWALAGVLYAVLMGCFFLLSLLSFAVQQDSGVLLGLAVLLPWPALPLVWLLRRGRPVELGGASAVLALVQCLLLTGAWGIQLAYLPLLVVGLAVCLVPGR